MNLLMSCNKINIEEFSKILSQNSVKNFELLSQILPPLTLKYNTKLYKDDGSEDPSISNNILEIRNGKYIRGQIEKGVMMSATNGVLHRVFNDHGNMACSNFVDDLQNLITEYMKKSAFSVGISDLIADSTTKQKIIQSITKQKMEVSNIIEKVQLGTFENKTSQSNNTEFEIQVNKILNNAMEETGKIARKVWIKIIDFY